MMDISQLNRPQTETASVSSTPKQKDTSQSDDKNSFDQHLNDNMEKAESVKRASNTEKTETNQSSETASAEEKTTETRPENESVVKQQAAESDNEATESAIDKAILSQLTIDAELVEADQQVIEESVEHQQILPQEGSDLPLSEGDEVIPVVLTKTAADTTVGTKNTDKPVSAVAVDVNTHLQQGGDTRQSVANNHQKSQIPAFNLTDEPVINSEIISAKAKVAVTNDDVKPTVNIEPKANSVSSILTTASTLQQVPGLTSAAASNMNPATTFSDPALAANTPLLKSSISIPVQNPNWSQGVSERVAWMVQGNFQNAEIKLNPAHLGPLEIKMSMNDDQANISFVSAHAPVRDALDQALPRLREMLEQQGLQLGDVDVSQYSESQHEDAREFPAGSTQTANEALTDAPHEDIQQGVLQVDSNSGVNLYA